MEEYETFCKKQLARIQGESMESELCLPAPPKTPFFIQFNGVPVLSPLLTLQRKKELQQDRQKALDLELWRQNSRKRMLLSRVEEIVANMQMKKLSSRSDIDQSEKEDIGSNVLNGLATQSCQVLPSSTDVHGALESKFTTCLKETDAQGGSDGGSLGEREQLNLHESEEAYKRLSGNRASREGTFSNLPSPSPSNEIEKKDAADLDLLDSPDRYVMSLQSLLKRSKEYIQREQIRRSLRSSSKRGGHDSHPDKENSAVQMNELAKDRGKFMGRSATVPALEKSAPLKPNSPQSPSFPKNHANVIASSSFSKVEISMRSATPLVLDLDSDEDFKKISLFERESSILHSLTGSYTKLPSPEPSLSPKMHRRRPHPSSVGHIVITDPVNASELSPKGKGTASDLMSQVAGERQWASDPVPKLSVDFVPIGPSTTPALEKSSPGVFSEPAVGRCSDVCQLSADRPESLSVSVSAEGELLSEGGSGCVLNPSPQELQDGSCLLLIQNPADVSTAQDRVKGSGPGALNRSYDVENPSPLLMQMQSEPQLDTPATILGHERALENGLEKVKRRLELETVKSVQKENLPWVASAGADEQEGQRHDQRHPGRAAFDAQSKTPTRSLSEALRQKMLALAELRQRLEDQHAQQLAQLIAEQEQEQERLQKEIEEQEWRLKQEKNAPSETDMSRMADSCGLGLEWRKISDTHLLDSVLTRVETVHRTSLENAGFVKSGLPSGPPFYLWEPPASGKSVSASRNINRNKMRWSQVYSPEMKRKLNKISALAKGFLTRRLLQTEKLKHLKQTVHDTMEFIRNFQSETLLKRGNVPAQDANLQTRVVAQLQAALYDIHDIFFKMEASERMNILRHDREVRKEKMLRQLDKAKTPRERVILSTATKKSLDRKKIIKASEMGIPNKKTTGKQKTPENRVLQPNQGQNAPIQRLLFRQGTPKASGKGEEQNRKKPPDSRVRNKARSGVSAGRIPKRKPNVATT